MNGCSSRQPFGQGAQGVHHVFLDGASRNPHPRGDFGVAQTLQLVQAEDGLGLVGQAANDADDLVQGVAVDDDGLGRGGVVDILVEARQRSISRLAARR